MNVLRDIPILTEKDNYKYYIDNGLPVAIYRSVKNNDNTFSRQLELYNCTDEEIEFMEYAYNTYIQEEMGSLN